MKPFVIALGAGAVGGWIASMLNLIGTGFGITIIPGTLHLNGQLLKYVFMVVFTTAPSFGLTYMFGCEDEASSVPAEDKEAEAIIEEETTGASSSIPSRRNHYLSDRWSSCCFV